MTNKTKSVLYIGITSNLEGRVWQHKTKFNLSFTQRYNVNRLVYYEVHDNPYSAIMREKQIKRWRREKKEWLIRTMNPNWQDLSEEWY